MMKGATRHLLLGVLLLAGGCGNRTPEGARLRVTVIGDAEPGNSLARRIAAEAESPTLVASDGAALSIPALASSWRFVDGGHSLILRLRPLKWSDGTPFVAADVVASLRRAAEPRRGTSGSVPATAPALALQYAGISAAGAIAAGRLPPSRLGVLAPTSRVVEIRLDAASPLLLGWLADPALAVTRPARKTGNSSGNAGTGNIAIDAPTLAAYRGSGPATDRIITRRTRSGDPDARPAQIHLSASIDATAPISAFVRGQGDIVIGEGLAGLGEARGVPTAGVLRLDPLWGVYGYRLNALSGPLSNPKVRLALAIAVERTGLTARYGIAAMAPVTGLVPPSLDPGRAPDWTTADPAVRLAQAKALLGAAGWFDARPLRLNLLLTPGAEHRSIAESVAADWARIGVIVSVTVVTAVVLDRLVARGDFDMALDESAMPVPDVAAMLSRWRCGAGAFCDTNGDALLAEARAAAPDARAPLLARAEAQLMAGPPLVPLFAPVRWALVSNKVTGWVPNAAGSHPLARLAAGRQN